MIIPEDIRNAFTHATRTFGLEPYGEILYLKHAGKKRDSGSEERSSDVWRQSVKKDIYLGSISVFPDSNGRYNTITVALSWT